MRNAQVDTAIDFTLHKIDQRGHTCDGVRIAIAADVVGYVSSGGIVARRQGRQIKLNLVEPWCNITEQIGTVAIRHLVGHKVTVGVQQIHTNIRRTAFARLLQAVAVEVEPDPIAQLWQFRRLDNAQVEQVIGDAWRQVEDGGCPSNNIGVTIHVVIDALFGQGWDIANGQRGQVKRKLIITRVDVGKLVLSTCIAGRRSKHEANRV